MGKKTPTVRVNASLKKKNEQRKNTERKESISESVSPDYTIEIERKRKRSHEIVDEMFDSLSAMRKTEAEKGKYSAKTDAAKWAIWSFGGLEKEILGWAYDHIYGSLCCFFVAGKPDDFDWDDAKWEGFEDYFIAEHYNDEYKEPEADRLPRQRPLDRGYISDNAYAAPYEVIRIYLSEILHCKKGLGDPNKNFNSALAYALSALNEGEVHTIFQPAKKGNMGNKATLDFLRWHCVLHVWAERGASSKNFEEAREKIAAELGITSDQLKSWEKSLSKFQDPGKRARETYKIFGSYFKSRDVNYYKSMEGVNEQTIRESQHFQSYTSMLEGQGYPAIWRNEIRFQDSLCHCAHSLSLYDTKKIRELMTLACNEPGRVNLSWDAKPLPEIKISPKNR